MTHGHSGSPSALGTPPSRYVATWANVACVDGIAAAAPVGLHFPDGTYRTPDGRPRERWLLVRLPRLDAVEVEVTLASEVRVRSGFTETAELSVRNLGVRELSIRTTGET